MASRYIRARRAEARYRMADRLLTAMAQIAIFGVCVILAGWTIVTPSVQAVRALIAVFL